MQLVIGERYRVRRINGEIVEGTLVQTKGNDDYYPTFEVTGLGLLGVHRDNVLGLVDDVAPHGGIPRVAEESSGESFEPVSEETTTLDMDSTGKHHYYQTAHIDMDSTGKHHYYQAAPDMEA